MHKKTISALVALAMTLTLTTSVLANPTEATNLTEAQQNLDNLKSQIQTIETQLLDAQLKQEQTQKDIADKQTEIEQNKADIEEANKKVEDSQELFNNRVRSMYKNGNDTVINVVFEAKSFGDLIDRVESIKTIAKHDKDILNELKDKKEELEAKKDKLNTDKENLDKMETDLEASIANFEKEKSENENLVAQAAAIRDQYQIDEQKDTRDSQSIFDGLGQNIPDYVPSRGSTSLSGEAVVTYARNFLGTPYVWGGTSPQPGFDCSGFVQYVYGHFGVYLSRTTYTQENQGYEVSRNNLQPGDLVFFGSPSYHVGIYVGNGYYIHSPETGDVVKVSSLSNSHGFSHARRVI